LSKESNENSSKSLKSSLHQNYKNIANAKKLIKRLLLTLNMPTHGSITKAGKVRSQTPKIQGRERHNPPPRISLRAKYIKRVELKRNPGQNWAFLRK